MDFCNDQAINEVSPLAGKAEREAERGDKVSESGTSVKRDSPLLIPQPPR